MNHETQTVVNWLGTDEGLYHQAMGLAVEVRDSAEVHDWDRDDQLAELAENLKGWLEGQMPDLVGIWDDFVKSAFYNVDWREVAEGVLPEESDES